MPTTSIPSARPRIGSRPRSRDRERRRRAEPFHRRAGGKKAAIHIPAQFFEPCRCIHDVAVENDGALDVADLADDHRPEMQAAANPRDDAEFAFQLARCARQLIAHRHEAAQRTEIDRAAAFRPGNDHLVADIIEDLAAIVHDRKREKTKRVVEKTVDADAAEPFGQPGRSRDIDEKHEAIFLDRRVIAPDDEVQERAPADDIGNCESQIHDNRETNGIDDGDPEALHGWIGRLPGKSPNPAGRTGWER